MGIHFKGILMSKFTNHLICEDSPYLLAHAHNPLDWYPWSEEAFEKARKENKLVFVSIGYSTCHWCHVMEKESFDNDLICTKVNENYVSIKVDKEEMPHIDKKYQDIHYLLNRRAGGWPLSIIMTPNKEVIFAATYLPPSSKAGMMGFSEVTEFIAEKYHNEAKEVYESIRSIQQAYTKFIAQNIPATTFDKSLTNLFVENIKQNYDDKFKGIGSAPKFPHASTFDTLIDIFHITNNVEALRLTQESYEAMAKGGIYDQIEGAFYRYSVDEAWLIPHFEKMLYTTAELINGYAKLYSIEQKPLFKNIIQESINAIKERFLKEGMFFSASDADSKHGEGRYFAFEYEGSKKALEKAGIEPQEVLEYFGISTSGNFEEGLSNPSVMSEKTPANLLHVKEVLKKYREEKEPYPFVDYKVLTSWNALMLNALIEAGKSVDTTYLEDAKQYLDSLLDKVYVNGTLYHQFVFGSELKRKALLEDFSFLIYTLLNLYQANYEKKYLDLAYTLSKIALEKFYQNGKWFLSEDLEALASLEDASYKSAQALMLQNIALLSLMCEDEKYASLFNEMLESSSGTIMRFPHAYPQALQAVFMQLFGAIVIKASKENLLHVKNLIETIKYPYLYIKEEDIKGVQACSMKACFYEGTNLDELKQKILENLL